MAAKVGIGPIFVPAGQKMQRENKKGGVAFVVREGSYQSPHALPRYKTAHRIPQSGPNRPFLRFYETLIDQR
jgi:hypothetical protein